MYLTLRPMQASLATRALTPARFGAEDISLDSMIKDAAKDLYDRFGPERNRVTATVGEGVNQTQVTIIVLPGSSTFAMQATGYGHYNFGTDGQFLNAIIDKQHTTHLDSDQKAILLRLLTQVAQAEI